MKVFTAQLPPTSCRFPSLGTNILVSTLFSDTMSSSRVTTRCACFVLYCELPDHYTTTRIYLTMFQQEDGFNPPNLHGVINQDSTNKSLPQPKPVF
jgi:hypothetical protein